MSAGGRDYGGLDGAGTWNAHNDRAGCPVRTECGSEDGQGEVSRDADDGIHAGVRASLTDSNREGMQDASRAITQVSCSEPRTFVHVRDKSGCLAGRKEEEKKAHDLHGSDSEGTEIIDIGRASDA